MEYSQKRQVWWYAISIMIISTLPYILGFSVQAAQENKEKWVFTGFVMGVEDGNSYVAKSLNGSYGEWLFRSPYTDVPQQGLVAFFPYILLGKLAAGVDIHTQLVVLFHIFRFITGILSIVAIANFLSLFMKDKKYFFWSLIIATVGGGLGWVLLVTNMLKLTSAFPLEFYSPEAFGFLNLLGLPHNSLARACMFWALTHYLQNLPTAQSSSIKNSVLLGVLWIGIGLAQPITAVIFGFLISLHSIFLIFYQMLIQHIRSDQFLDFWKKQVSTLAVSGIIATPLLIYTFIKFNIDPFLISWAEQNIITSPHFGYYAISFGLFWMLSIPGIRALLRDQQDRGLFIMMWVIVAPILAYLPINIQRRLTEGSWVALVCLGAVGIQQLLQKVKKKSRQILLIVIATVCAGSTIIIYSGSLITVLHPSLPIYRYRKEVEAFEFIEKNAYPDDLILTSYETGNALPAWANIRVMIGHGPESVGIDEKEDEIRMFYSHNLDDDYRTQFIDQYSIRYIFWGPAEQDLGGWNPVFADYLKLIYQADEYYIFQTNLPNHTGMVE